MNNKYILVNTPYKKEGKLKCITITLYFNNYNSLKTCMITLTHAEQSIISLNQILKDSTPVRLSDSFGISMLGLIKLFYQY